MPYSKSASPIGLKSFYNLNNKEPLKSKKYIF